MRWLSTARSEPPKSSRYPAQQAGYDELALLYLTARVVDVYAMTYIAGPIILAAAPCTAMVFVWSHLSDGEPHFTLSHVALNDLIMVFAFAPIVGLLLGLRRSQCRGHALERGAGDHCANGTQACLVERRAGRARPVVRRELRPQQGSPALPSAATASRVAAVPA